jgi:DNA-binding response OmpR family regulator
MGDQTILEGKKLLLVDDEPDVVETLKDLLGMCVIDTAADFETGEKSLTSNKYDIAILDIMGVNGYKLLETAKENAIPALILTANALTADDFAKSLSQGAVAYIPKEKMIEIPVYLTDLLKSQEGTEKPHRWFSRLESFFDKIFGINQTYHELKREYIKKHGPIQDA